MEAQTRSSELRRLRNVARLSQRAVSKRSGITCNRLCLFENGYIELRDEEYGLALRVILDAIREQRDQLREVLSKPGAPLVAGGA